jgi:hypothetical protein
MQFGFQNKVVYAMEVTQKMTMQKYESFCKNNLPQKIPNWNSKNYEERVGDSIYNFSSKEPRPKILKSVHNKDNIDTDLRGKYTLLSDHFYYFGDNPEPLPDFLLPIVKQGQGHKSISNNPHIHKFIDWIMTKTKAKNTIFSQPQARHLFMNDEEYRNNCGMRNKCFDELDEEIGDEKKLCT